MIVKSIPSHPVRISTDLGAVTKFKMKASAHSFRIISSGIYSNKIKSPIRELASNALDIHVHLNKADVPFECHIPTVMEPWFSIRDYGTGLTPMQIVGDEHTGGVYTTYFESPKTDQLNQIGGYGLGSKSPYAYTDNFTITSIVDGKKWIYAAFIDDIGEPAVSLLAESDTDEPSGLEVSFAVNDNADFSKFAHECISIFKWYEVKPNFKGKSNINVDVLKYKATNLVEGVHLLDNFGEKAVAVMGTVEYPISIPSSEKELSDSLRGFLKYPLVIHFNIGELETQPSREGLRYTNHTISAIKNKLLHLEASLHSSLKNDLSGIKNEWDMCTYLQEKYHSSSIFKNAVSSYVSTISGNKFWKSWGYNGCNIEVNTEYTDMNIRIDGFNISHGMARSKRVDQSIDYSITPPLVSKKFKCSVNNKNAYFVYNDLKTGAKSRALAHFRKVKGAFDVMILQKIDDKKDADLDAFKAELAFPNIILASQLDKVVRSSAKRKETTISELGIRRLSFSQNSSRYGWTDAVLNSDALNSGNFYYIPLNGLTAMTKKMNMEDLAVALGTVNLKGISGCIYGVPKKAMGHVNQLSNWINLEDHIVKFLENYDFDQCSIAKYGAVQAESDSPVSVNTLTALAKKLPKSNIICSIINDSYQHNGNGYYVGSRFESLLKNYGPVDAVEKYYKSIEYIKSALKDISMKYPMLNHLNSYPNIDVVVDYINIIDSISTVTKKV